VLPRLTLAVLLVLMLAGLGFIGVLFFDQIACEGQPINNNAVPTQDQQILGDRIISQSFVAPRHGLERLDLFFQTYNRQNTHDIHLRLIEVTKPPLEGSEKFQTTFNAAAVNDQSWHRFSFPPIADSAGKTYLISLQSPTSTDGNAITVGGIERNSYLPGTAYLGPTPVPADITFRSCYQMTLLEKLQVLAEQITRNRPFWWGNIIFYGLILVVYTLLLGAFFWKLSIVSLKNK
jgi:hypothetical protein